LFTVVLFSRTHAAASGRALASALGQTVGPPVIVDLDQGSAAGGVDLEPTEPLPRYIAFLDTDDVWLPHRLQLALAGLARAPVTWCASRAVDELPGGPRPDAPRTASAIAVDRTVLVGDGSPLADVDALRAVFVSAAEVWDRWGMAHPVAAVDEVGVLTGGR
jgi:hypothetical protein